MRELRQANDLAPDRSVIFTAGNLLHLAGAVGFVVVFGREREELADGIHLLMIYLLTGAAGSGALAVLPGSGRLERLPIRPILAAIVLVNVAGPLMGIGGWAGSAAHGAGLGVGALYRWTLRSRRERIRASRPYDLAPARPSRR